MCVDIPECIELKPIVKHDERVLCIDVENKCDYDLLVYLYIKKQNQVLQNIAIEVGASERKRVEVSISDVEGLAVSGEWGLKGTSLRLPLREVAVGR